MLLRRLADEIGGGGGGGGGVRKVNIPSPVSRSGSQMRNESVGQSQPEGGRTRWGIDFIGTYMKQRKSRESLDDKAEEAENDLKNHLADLRNKAQAHKHTRRRSFVRAFNS